MDLLELEAGVNPDIHWYYQSKKIPLVNFAKEILKTTSPITIVDVGSGSGFFAIALNNELGDKIKKVYMVDINYTAEELESTKDQKVQKVIHIPDVIENGLVIMMDVLEHLPDDLKMLQDIKAASKGDSNYFFITVPAFKSLWSGHDDYLGHYRRYKIPMLRDVLQKANFSNIQNIHYLYGLMFPAVWMIRKIKNVISKKADSNMKPASPIVNKVLLTVNGAEMSVAKSNKLFGVTCSASGRI